MNKRSSASARVLAATALVVGLVVVLIAIGAALGGGGDGSSGSHHRKQAGAAKQQAKPKRVPATYEVKSGDTLISIAHNTGVPVARIEELNPEVDPQILVAGEQLKLR